MIRQVLVAVCVLLALATGALMLVTWLRPVATSGPETLGPTAYALAVRGDRMVAHFWRYTNNPPAPASRRLGVTPVLVYEREVKRGATSLSYTWIDPCPHGLSASATRGTLVTRQVEMTLWLPLLVFLLFPVVAFIRGPVRRWRRRKRGECVACGYDLTGNVSGICPECGAEIQAPASTDGATQP
jgi:hypothetical protein